MAAAGPCPFLTEDNDADSHYGDKAAVILNARLLSVLLSSPHTVVSEDDPYSVYLRSYLAFRTRSFDAQPVRRGSPLDCLDAATYRVLLLRVLAPPRAATSARFLDWTAISDACAIYGDSNAATLVPALAAYLGAAADRLRWPSFLSSTLSCITYNLPRNVVQLATQSRTPADSSKGGSRAAAVDVAIAVARESASLLHGIAQLFTLVPAGVFELLPTSGESLWSEGGLPAALVSTYEHTLPALLHVLLRALPSGSDVARKEVIRYVRICCRSCIAAVQAILEHAFFAPMGMPPIPSSVLSSPVVVATRTAAAASRGRVDPVQAAQSLVDVFEWLSRHASEDPIAICLAMLNGPGSVTRQSALVSPGESLREIMDAVKCRHAPKSFMRDLSRASSTYDRVDRMREERRNGSVRGGGVSMDALNHISTLLLDAAAVSFPAPAAAAAASRKAASAPVFFPPDFAAAIRDVIPDATDAALAAAHASGGGAVESAIEFLLTHPSGPQEESSSSPARASYRGPRSAAGDTLDAETRRRTLMLAEAQEVEEDEEKRAAAAAVASGGATSAEHLRQQRQRNSDNTAVVSAGPAAAAILGSAAPPLPSSVVGRSRNPAAATSTAGPRTVAAETGPRSSGSSSRNGDLNSASSNGKGGIPVVRAAAGGAPASGGISSSIRTAPAASVRPPPPPTTTHAPLPSATYVEEDEDGCAVRKQEYGTTLGLSGAFDDDDEYDDAYDDAIEFEVGDTGGLEDEGDKLLEASWDATWQPRLAPASWSADNNRGAAAAQSRGGVAVKPSSTLLPSLSTAPAVSVRRAAPLVPSSVSAASFVPGSAVSASFAARDPGPLSSAGGGSLGRTTGSRRGGVDSGGGGRAADIGGRGGTAAAGEPEEDGSDDTDDGGGAPGGSTNSSSGARGRGRGRGGRGGSGSGGVVTGHGPRALGGLTEVQAARKGENKARRGNHNRKRGADKKLAKGMF